MTRDFDTLIREAAPAVPDPGDTRRLNRALLKQRVARGAARKARRRRVSVLAMGVALSFLAAGDVTDLGSDHFDLAPRQVLNDTSRKFFEEAGVTSYDMGLRGQSVMRYENQSEAEALGFAIQDLMDEGEFVQITGLFTETGYHWSAQFRMKQGEQSAIRGRDPHGVSSKISKELCEFTLAHFDDLVERLGRIPAPNPRTIDIVLEDRTRQFFYWRLVYPDFGPIEYYVSVENRKDP